MKKSSSKSSKVSQSNKKVSAASDKGPVVSSKIKEHAQSLNKPTTSTTSSNTTSTTTSFKPSTLDLEISRKAVAALFTYEAKRQIEAPPRLIDDYAKPIIAQVQLVQVINSPVIRPIRVAIPYSLFSNEAQGHTLCFFCKSEDKEKLEGYFKSNPFDGLTKIISVNQVRKLYSAFKDRKELLSEHTHFACDARIMTQIYNLLGKTFGSRNNYPIPIEFETISKLPAALKKYLDSTYMNLSGSNIAIRLGHTGMNPNDVTQNVVRGLEYAVQKMKFSWKSVQNIYIKLSDSPSLPIYNKSCPDIINYMKEKKNEIDNSKKNQTSKQIPKETDVVVEKNGKNPPKGKKVINKPEPEKIPTTVFKKVEDKAPSKKQKPKQEIVEEVEVVSNKRKAKSVPPPKEDEVLVDKRKTRSQRK